MEGPCNSVPNLPFSWPFFPSPPPRPRPVLQSVFLSQCTCRHTLLCPTEEKGSFSPYRPCPVVCSPPRAHRSSLSSELLNLLFESARSNAALTVSYLSTRTSCLPADWGAPLGQGLWLIIFASPTLPSIQQGLPKYLQFLNN